jgi:hypothetical protein
MRKTILFILVMLMLPLSSSAEPRVSDEEIIRAYLECPEIVAAQNDIAKGARLGAPRIVFRNSACGAAGCQFTALVAQSYERRRADPFVMHLLAFVHVGPKNGIALVERVVLVPAKDLKELERDEKQ